MKSVRSATSAVICAMLLSVFLSGCACITGCATTSEKYPVKQMLDPVTEDVPHVQF